MKILRYLDSESRIYHGVSGSDGIVRRIDGNIFGDFVVTEIIDKPAKLLAPVEPAQILGIGLNYRRHADECGVPFPAQPVLFVKGINTLQNPNDPIEIPTFLKSEEVDYECELAVVIGRTCKNVPKERALEYVAGYTCCNDVSARDWQLKHGGGQWSRGKIFDTFCPLGPCLVTREDIPDPNRLAIRTYLNGETVQSWNTDDMIFSVPALIEFLSGSTTLPAGTVILTGTPHGVGMAARPPLWLKPGDVVTIEIERIGRLSNPVTLEQAITQPLGIHPSR